MTGIYSFIKAYAEGQVAWLVLNRPEILNAWHRPMRNEVVDAFDAFDRDERIRAIVMTGAGKAFGAGQDLNESKQFDGHRGAEWIEEWRVLYGRMRGLTKPLIAALNGVTAGSAFQAALLADVRIAHPGVTLGQPEIDSGIPSVTGFWIIREALGLSRTTELVVTGRLMGADEAHRIGLVHYLVPEAEVLPKARELASLLAAKPPIAMRLDKQRFREATDQSFDEAMDAAVRIHREAYDSGEPQRVQERFLAMRAARRTV
ncbi:MAG: enoyl-CoA hydratase/isomerase family protein [Vicinamibacterales bacterium]